MAILHRFEATVIVNGNALTEYDLHVDDQDNEQRQNTVVKYIEAVSDTTFSLKLVIKPYHKLDCDLLGWNLYTDGRYANGEGLTGDFFRKRRCVVPLETYFTGAPRKKEDQWVLQDFKFSNVSLGQTDQGEQVSGDRVAKAGELKVELWRYSLNSDRMREDKSSFKPLGKVSEKMLKGQAVSHIVGLGTTWAVGKRIVCDAKKIGDGPLATFVFKYRSRKALKDLMIIPRTPSPVPPEERPVEQLSVEEMRALIQRQRAEATVKQDTQPGIKQESQQGIKREREPSPLIRFSPDPEPASGTPAEPDSDIELIDSRPVKKTRVEVSLVDD